MSFEPEIFSPSRAGRVESKHLEKKNNNKNMQTQLHMVSNKYGNWMERVKYCNLKLIIILN